MLPTEGADDVLSQRRRVAKRGEVSEINLSGYGGGSVVTMDGITFGVEVCRDHLVKRLHNFYFGDPSANPPVSRAAANRDPRAQVQLIPSWGAWIDRKSICCVDNGLIFNVDGAEAKTAARIFDKPSIYDCEKHSTVTASSSIACSDCRKKYKFCSKCGEMPASNCTCSPVDTTFHLDRFVCKKCQSLENVSPCPTCASVLKPYYLDFNLTRFGSEIPTKKTDLPVSSGGKTWEDYFDAEGKVDVYEPRAIPPAKKMGK